MLYREGGREIKRTMRGSGVLLSAIPPHRVRTVKSPYLLHLIATPLVFFFLPPYVLSSLWYFSSAVSASPCTLVCVFHLQADVGDMLAGLHVCVVVRPDQRLQLHQQGSCGQHKGSQQTYTQALVRADSRFTGTLKRTHTTERTPVILA